MFLNMIVPCQPGFIPAHMEVKEASAERGKLPPRVCLLGSDMHTYKVFALPEDPFTEASKG
jgi:anaphase-promoting complex subunit 4